jgi:hypothetical protein
MVKNEATVEQLCDGRAFKIWRGDLWECPSCEHELVTGFGSGPLAEAHDTGRYLAFLPGVVVSLA